MTNTKLLSQLTNIEVKEILQNKQSTVSNRVRLIFADVNDDIYLVTANDNYDALMNDKFYFASQIKMIDNVDLEDVKDLFRTNGLDLNSVISTIKVGNYNDHFKLWGIDDVKSLIGHSSTDRACVSDYVLVEDAELIYGGQILKVEYSTGNSEEGTETVLYTDYMPVNDKTEKDAGKAIIARYLFGADKAQEIVKYGQFASIKTEEELAELTPLQRIHYSRYNDGKYFVSIYDIKTLPNGETIMAMINQMINNKDIYNSNFAIDNGLHQGHLSEMRNGKRDVNRMTLNNVIKYIDAYKY